MGIPSYYKRLTSNIKGLISRGKPGRISYLWMDFNCLIYHCLARPDMPKYSGESGWEELFLEEIAKYCQRVVAEVGPTEGVYIAVDGVVPMAKMKQQRLRRFKSAAMADDSKWDTNAITPGTEFMDKLKVRLERLCNKHKGWKLSAANEPGEGEHKIMDRWRQSDFQSSSSQIHAVYGLDADLVVLSLLNAPGPTWLFREAMEGGEIKRMGGEEEFEWFSIDLLRDYLTNPYSNKKQAIQNYCCAMSFLGNDFLPSALSFKMRLDGHDRLLELLAGMAAKGTNLVGSDGEISKDGLQHLIGLLAANEEDRIVGFIKKKMAMADRNKDAIQETVERILLNGSSFVLKSNWQDIYLNSWFGGRGTGKAELCIEYLYGIQWIWNYYRGKPVCYNWHYNWHLPPLWKWLAAACGKMPIVGEPKLVAKDIKPDEQLALVLPLRSWHLVRGAAEKYVPIVAPWYYPTKFGYTTIGKSLIWECEAEIPVPTILEIKGLAGAAAAVKTK
jgi:5'-3' exonuclease